MGLMLFYVIIAIHDIPYKIAEKRQHSHRYAIHAAGHGKEKCSPACRGVFNEDTTRSNRPERSATWRMRVHIGDTRLCSGGGVPHQQRECLQKLKSKGGISRTWPNWTCARKARRELGLGRASSPTLSRTVRT